MKAERLFRVLGLVDPALVEEAARRRRRWTALAACLALMIAGLGGFLGSRRGADGGASGGAPADTAQTGGIGDQTAFMSYGGPVLPLTTLEDPSGLTAERTAAFAPCTDGRRWGAEVTDAYVLSNPTDGGAAVTALYPFTGSLLDLAKLRPAVTVDGQTAETALYAGPCSLASSDAGGPGPLESWEGCKALLEDGTYLARALEEPPALDVPVTVYEFSDFAAPHEQYRAATQAISFSIDEAKTQILTYGFNGMEWDGSFRRYSYFVPDGVLNEPDWKVLIVLGEDIGDYALQGYRDGGCAEGEEIEGVSCSLTRTETTMDAVLDRLCRYYYDERCGPEGLAAPFELYRGAAAELLAGSGALFGADGSGGGRLDDVLAEAMSRDRVLYLAFPVTVPAGESVCVSCTFWKAPSFNHGGLEDSDLQGYDLAVQLGSSLEFTGQRAVLAWDAELAEQNFGFDPESGVTSVELTREHYFMELRPKGE